MMSVIPQGAERTLMTIGGTLGGALSFAFGDIGALLIWLAAFVIADFLTGTWAAIVTGEWKSSRNYVGVIKKVLIFGVVAMAHGLDVVFREVIQIEIFQSIVICAYAAGEFGSVVENLERGGLHGVVPPVIRRMLKAVNHRLEETVDKIEGDRDK